MIRLRNFQGSIPRVHPTLLPEGFSQKCLNARMRSGALVPFRHAATAATLTGGPFSTIFKFSGAWRGYGAGVSVVPGPVADDRAYIAGDGVPRVQKFGTGAFSYPLALPSPVAAPSATVSGTGTGDAERVVFAFTWVTSLGEESPPSPLSPAVSLRAGQTVAIAGFGTTPSGRGITKRRVYRSVTDFSGVTQLYFVSEIATSVTTLNYSTAMETAEPIASMDYDVPPDALKGLTTMPNGIVAGFVGRELFFCEPFRLHAWPRKYSLTVDYDIVGLAAFGSTLAIMTTGTPYVVQGAHPSTMTMTKIEQNLPCVAADGIVDLGYAAAYPSHEGLVTIAADGAKLVTAALFTKQEWAALTPTSFKAAQYEGRYVFLFEPAPDPLAEGMAGLVGVSPAGFWMGGSNPQTVAGARMGLIDLTGDTPAFIASTTSGKRLAYDIASGDLFILASDGLTIRRFDDPAASPMVATWRSKRLVSGDVQAFGWAQLNADDIGAAVQICTAEITRDGQPHHTISGANRHQRLPAGMGRIYEVEITTNMAVYSFGMAYDVGALQG